MKTKMFYFLRSMQIIGLMLVLATIFYQLNQLHLQSIELRYKQTEKSSQSLINLAAAEAERYFNTNQVKDLQRLINDLSNDPMVRDATIYDNLGQVLYKSENSISLKQLLKIDDSDNDDIEGIVPHISELFDGEKKIGYILVSVRQSQLIGLIQGFQKSLFSMLLLVFAMAFLAGMIVMAIIHKKVEGAYYGLQTEIPRLIKQNTENLITSKSKNT